MQRNTSRHLVRLVLGLITLGYFGFQQWQKSQQPAEPTPQGTAQNDKRSSPDTSSNTPASQNSNEGHLLLGNPSRAATAENNFLLERPQYALSYNRERGGANWVAWHTDASNLGDISRGRFRPDPLLPKSWQITPNDYTNSGYDRGHLCPSADRDNTRQDNDATFYMSNMVPQTAQLNQHVWADFEIAIRNLIRSGNEVYQYAGSSGEAERIAGGKVAVPKVCWKVVVVLPTGQSDLKRINNQTKVLAVVMPNTTDKKLESADWRSYQTSVKEIETLTGLNFFSALPASVEKSLEKKGA